MLMFALRLMSLDASAFAGIKPLINNATARVGNFHGSN
jgi:hypothetical protein